MWILVLAMLGALVAFPHAQQPQRGPSRSPVVAAGALSGVVTTDEEQPRPLRRVRVFLNSLDTDADRTTITDDEGAFAFEGLTSGRYSIGGTKEGYVTMNLGARGPGRPGTPIALKEKQAIAGLTLRLPRGGVITGTLFDAEGQPLPGVAMRALRYGYTPNGERQLTPVYTGAATQFTDDRGVYRIYGLSAGDYVVVAPARLPASDEREVVMMTEAEVRRGLDELKQAGRRTAPAPVERVARPGAFNDMPRVAYAPVFYPGTTVPSQAGLVRMREAEERREVDFQVQFVPVTMVRGTVVGAERVSSDYLRVHLVASGGAVIPGNEGRTATVARDGVFSFASVPPGAHTLIATATTPGSLTPIQWASTEVVADGQPQLDVTLALQRTFTLSGRVAFEGAEPPRDLTRVRVRLEPLLSGGQVSVPPPTATANAAGRFSVPGLTLGRYRLIASVVGQSSWMLKSAIVDGHDLADVPVEARGSMDGAVLTFIRRASELSGAVRDQSGRAMAGYSVVLFPLERTLWMPGARRIRAAVSATDGTYRFRALPAGGYALVAVPYVEDGQWFDREFLESVVSASVKVTLAEGEAAAHDVRPADLKR